MKGELIYKIRNMIDPEFKKKDFSIYIRILKKISPLSVDILGEDFFLKSFPTYFQELRLNEENLEENLFYLPLFFKKYQTKFSIPDFIVELLDYESVCYQTLKDETVAKQKPLYTDINAEVHMNPTAQALRHEHDIHQFVQKIKAGKWTKEKTPEKEKTLLLVSKNPETNELVFLKGNIHHAAALDELHDGKMIKKDLIQALANKFPDIAQRDWIVVLKDLKEHYVVIES